MADSLGTDEFAHAFALHGRSLWVLAAAWVGRDDADDLVQETARVAWQQRDRFRRGDDARPWLSQIARHLGANWRRKHRLQLVDDLHEAAASPEVAAPEVPAWPLDADRHGLSDELARALSSLSETARACVLLNVIAEHTFAEIGTMLELPANTVASHVRRAREALRASLAATAADNTSETP